MSQKTPVKESSRTAISAWLSGFSLSTHPTMWGLDKVWQALKKQRDIYPVIVFALLPSLAFWSGANVTELTLSLMTRVLVMSVLVGTAYYGILALILQWRKPKNEDQKTIKYKASLLAIIAILASFLYRYLFAYFKDGFVSAFGARKDAVLNDYFIWILAVVFIAIFLFVKYRLRFSQTLRNYVALLATVLLILNLYPIVRQWIGTYDLKDIEFGAPVLTPSDNNQGNQPDIYYLVFDRYANKSTLKDIYKFDNEPFLGSLKNKGFYIANESTANYPYTSFSLASSLNLDYLPSQLNERSENGLFTSILHNAIEDNRTVDFLKDQGYSFINIGPWWNTTKYSKHADQNLYNPAGVVVAGHNIDLQEHEMLLFQDTIFWQFSRRPVKLFGRTLHRRTYPPGDTAGRAIHKQTAIHQFKSLKEISETSGPKFVFAHFLQPHDPYVFDENCRDMPRDIYGRDYEYEREQDKYIKQLQCTNSRIQETIEHILANSPTDPIIIIQADEGPYPKEYRENENLEWSKVSNELIHQKANILNAYYFPDRDYDQLYSYISPVNSFRIVFNQYFGTNLPLFKDRHFFSESSSKRFSIFEVTDKFRDDKSTSQ